MGVWEKRRGGACLCVSDFRGFDSARVVEYNLVRGDKMHSVTIKSDKPVVVISADEYESMKETIALLSSNAELPKELEEEKQSIARGEFITWSEFKKKYKVK